MSGRVVKGSAFVPLTYDGFMETFEELWSEHVDFGTSRSHKKLVGKKRKEPSEWRARLEAKAQEKGEVQPAQKLVGGKEARRRVEGNRQQTQPVGAVVRPGSVAVTVQPAPVGTTQQKLTNKGRWGATMAAMLLKPT